MTRDLAPFVALLAPLAGCFNCVDSTCEKWERDVDERCEWTIGKTVSEVEERFGYDFERDAAGRLGNAVLRSQNGTSQVDLPGCAEPGACAVTVSGSTKYLCIDGGTEDANSLDRIDWVCAPPHEYCDDCVHGVRDCCYFHLWFLDQPEPCYGTEKYTDPCNSLPPYMTWKGCTLSYFTDSETIWQATPIRADCQAVE